METGNRIDNWIRPLGASAVVLFGLLGILLSFVMRESNVPREEQSLTQKLLFSANFVENWFYDLRTARFYQNVKISPNIVVLEITDESLNKIGRWPWTRPKHGIILDHLKSYGAKVVMFDATFPEPESEAADGAFADSIKRFTADNSSAVILGYDTTTNPDEALAKIPDEFQMSMINGQPAAEPMGGATLINRFNFAAPRLVQMETNFGYIGFDPDLDGVFRHAKMVAEIDKVYYPSLGYSGFNAFYSDGKSKKTLIEPFQGGGYYLKLLSEKGEEKIVLNAKGELKVRFYGGPEAFIRVPIHEVLLDEKPASNQEMKNIFAGKVVLIGSSAFGAHDLRHTPVDSQSPGMYMHANLFHALDQHLFYKSDDHSMLLTFLIYFIGIIGVLLLARTKEPLWETGGTFMIVGAIYGADYFYFAPNGYFLRLFFTLTGIVNLYAWFTVLNVFKEAREKKKIKDTFQRYVAPEIVKEMLANPEKLKVGGEKKEITMLFSDVRDFTSISERLTPQELSTLLNIYMGKMTDILFETHGTLDKYIGDAMVGFWGAPLDIKDHAYHAVRGASMMLDALPAINKEFERRKFPRINVGIGLNTGEVSVGNMGSDKIFAYTALGDNMNLASRLESLTKHYGVNLMISEFTLAKLGERQKEFRIRPLDLVQVKGKSQAVKIYEVIPSWNPISKEDALLAKYTDTYETKYLKRQFSEAITAFSEILHHYPDDKATKLMKENAEKFLQNPPPADWDGVTIFQTK